MADAAQRIARLVTELLDAPLPVGLRAWDGSAAGPVQGPVVVLRTRRALRHLLWAPGELGLARAYVTGDLDVDGDLSEGLRRAWATVGAAAPRPGPRWLIGALGEAIRLGSLGPRPAPPADEARPRGRLHSKQRDRDVIAHHYDRGNRCYELLLDPSMAYSCGYWDGPETTLVEAQHAKLDLICEKLGLDKGMRLLDVGCGWGALVVHAAREYGAHVTGITIAEQQARYVRERARAEGLDELVEVRVLDYRDLDEQDSFDAAASIEMGEHVGEHNYPHYARLLADALRPGGKLLLQQMSRGSRAPGGGAFIESYIAPDMTMRPLSATLAHLEQAGLEPRSVQAMREQYVRTIRAWAATLERRWDEFAAVAGNQYARVWRLYLAGAALAFEQGRMGVDQIVASVRE